MIIRHTQKDQVLTLKLNADRVAVLERIARVQGTSIESVITRLIGQIPINKVIKQ